MPTDGVAVNVRAMFESYDNQILLERRRGKYMFDVVREGLPEPANESPRSLLHDYRLARVGGNSALAPPNLVPHFRRLFLLYSV